MRNKLGIGIAEFIQSLVLIREHIWVFNILASEKNVNAMQLNSAILWLGNFQFLKACSDSFLAEVCGYKKKTLFPKQRQSHILKNPSH